MSENELAKQYTELVDALCPPPWLPRNDHERVVAFAKRFRGSDFKIIYEEYKNKIQQRLNIVQDENTNLKKDVEVAQSQIDKFRKQLNSDNYRFCPRCGQSLTQDSLPSGECRCPLCGQSNDRQNPVTT